MAKIPPYTLFSLPHVNFPHFEKVTRERQILLALYVIYINIFIHILLPSLKHSLSLFFSALATSLPFFFHFYLINVETISLGILKALAFSSF